MDTVIKLPSGATLEVGLLGSEEAWAVSQALLNEAKSIKIEGFERMDFKAMLSGGLIPIVGPLCQLLSSPVILAEAKKCFAQCTYNGVKVIQNWPFEKKEARADFLPACFYALRENVAPFFVGLSSFLPKS